MRGFVPKLISSLPTLFMVAGVAFLVLGLSSCARGDREMLENLLELEGQSYDEASGERIRELRSDIRRYQSRVNDAVSGLANESTARRMLAIEYMNNGMFALAMEEFERAAAVQTQNPALFYYAGVAAGHAAKAVFDEGDRQKLLERAEWMYKRAVELRPDYPDAWYGLAVVQVFELENAEAGLETVRQLRAIEPRHIEGRFVEARALVMLDRVQEAVEVYEFITREAPRPEQRDAARRNASVLLQGAR
ncbi:MAG: hypothetical protein EA428_07645 [Spirochaetaceae bacterium]|nr:MAG: hypothetical protein EA428_07645 [Spirochaetaceae bacterium]